MSLICCNTTGLKNAWRQTHSDNTSKRALANSVDTWKDSTLSENKG